MDMDAFFLMRLLSVFPSHCTFLSDLSLPLFPLPLLRPPPCLLLLVMICHPPSEHFPTLLFDVIKIFFPPPARENLMACCGRLACGVVLDIFHPPVSQCWLLQYVLLYHINRKMQTHAGQHTTFL